MVAVHLRRGDYKRHCPRLAGWHSIYMGFNNHPSLPDKFDPTPYFAGTEPEDPAATERYYLEHCLPTIEQVVKRLRDVRREHPELKRVYVLSNGWGWFLDSLKAELLKDGWGDLKSSLDVSLDREQNYVGMAVDMAIAEKAAVFVGNGVSLPSRPQLLLIDADGVSHFLQFSSLSSNIVMLRMAKGLAPSTNRFL